MAMVRVMTMLARIMSVLAIVIIMANIGRQCKGTGFMQAGSLW